MLNADKGNQQQRKRQTKRVTQNDEKNKAVCMAAIVADGWAGAENLEKWMDRRTEKRLIESHVRDLKSNGLIDIGSKFMSHEQDNHIDRYYWHIAVKLRSKC